jgi:hypothetical protein
LAKSVEVKGIVLAFSDFILLQIYSLNFGGLPFQYFTIVDLVESIISLWGELPPKSRPKWQQLKLKGRTRLQPIGSQKGLLLGDQRSNQLLASASHFSIAYTGFDQKNFMPMSNAV